MHYSASRDIAIVIAVCLSVCYVRALWLNTLILSAHGLPVIPCGDMSMSIAIFSVAQILKLLQSPRKRVRWEQKCHNKIWGKDLRKRNVWDVDGKQVMRGWLNVQWRGIPENGCCYGKRATSDSSPTEWCAGLAVVVTKMNEVGHGRADRRREPADSSKGGGRPCSTRKAVNVTLKSTRSGRCSQRSVTRASVPWS